GGREGRWGGGAWRGLGGGNVFGGRRRLRPPGGARLPPRLRPPRRGGLSRMLRIALIGCGGIGALRAKALASLPSYRLAVVSDLVPGRAEALAARHGARVVTDWRAAVSDGAIDVVVVSTPPSSHADVCVAALGKGKDVLCEKPLARNAEESRLIVEAARRAGRLVATGFNYRFYPSIVKAREVLDAGVIGRLDHVRSYAGYSATEHSQ